MTAATRYYRSGIAMPARHRPAWTVGAEDASWRGSVLSGIGQGVGAALGTAIAALLLGALAVLFLV